MIAFDCWIDIRCFGLFLSLGLEVEFQFMYATFTEAIGWGRVFIPRSVFSSFLFRIIAFISFLRHFLLSERYFPHSSSFFWKCWWVGVKCRGGRALLDYLGYEVLNRCQNLSSKGGESEQDIPRVVRGIATWSDACDQPWLKNLPRLSAPPP